MAFLREAGRGFAVGGPRVPIVPAAILFDLANGGDKGWDRYPPYREFGYAAAAAASQDFALGSVGAGIGCNTATFKGGLGSASTSSSTAASPSPRSSPSTPSARRRSAAAGTSGRRRFEIGGEFGGLGMPHPMPADAARPRTKLGASPGTNTTIAIVATDAILDKAAAKRLAIAGQDGLARAFWPAHTDFDGDLVFAVATGRSGIRARTAASAASTSPPPRRRPWRGPLRGGVFGDGCGGRPAAGLASGLDAGQGRKRLIGIEKAHAERLEILDVPRQAGVVVRLGRRRDRNVREAQLAAGTASPLHQDAGDPSRREIERQDMAPVEMLDGSTTIRASERPCASHPAFAAFRCRCALPLR